MANGSGPSPSGLIILTGMTIAAVVGLYAYDAIPRRDGVAASANVGWPRWQAGSGTQPTAQTQSPQPPAYAPQDDRQQQPPKYPQEPRGQDVPYDQQSSEGGAGQPTEPADSQR